MMPEKVIFMNTAAPDPRIISEWVERGWLVFNAPMPIPGCAYELGEFRHGTFYAAVNPTLPMADRVLQEIRGLDGWPVQLVNHQEIQALVSKHLCDADVPLSDALETWGGWPALARAGGWPWHEEG